MRHLQGRARSYSSVFVPDSQTPLTSLASPILRAVVCLASTASPLDPTALAFVAVFPVPGRQERLGRANLDANLYESPL
jgi:hypothetical protein